MSLKQAGLPTRYMLVAALVLIVASVTLSSLLIIRSRLQRQVLSDLSGDLAQTVQTFQALESQRLAALQRENALLADLPSLKALMTTSDERTIADGAIRFWKISDNDLFALATNDDHIVTAYTRGAEADAELRNDLSQTLIRNASLDWGNTKAFIELERPIISPNLPTSLVAVAEPALAWSGNLWTWAPQVGISHRLDLGGSHSLSVDAALIDVPDPPALQTTSTAAISQAERSRWPGSEFHLGLAGKPGTNGPLLGVGGYVSPHKYTDAGRYNAWAGNLDFRTPLPRGLQLSGSFYRGLALGGLGGGTYKDYIYRATGTTLTPRPLDDVGGWAQMNP